MARHTHQYTIADDEAVKVLLDKLLSGGPHQQRREKLLKALDEAYNATGLPGKRNARHFSTDCSLDMRSPQTLVTSAVRCRLIISRPPRPPDPAATFLKSRSSRPRFTTKNHAQQSGNEQGSRPNP